jgi:TPR repeat protein
MASGFLALASPAMAGPLEDAHAAYERGDYATAMSLWRPLADQGDTVAEDNLGLMYFRGQVVPQDYAQAFAWWRLAAVQGDTGPPHSRNLSWWVRHGSAVRSRRCDLLSTT